MRIFTGALATETNTFSPLPTGLAAFTSREYLPAGTHPDHMTFYGGPLWVARERAQEYGWTVVEGLVASAQPGGITTRAAYETLRDELLADLRAALPVDMVLLGLHGAMVADGYDDCEGDILRRVRDMVGPDVTVGAELDPHAHLTPLMVEQATVLVLFKEYPHIDVYERACELVDLCRAAHQGRQHPTPALVDCDMVVPMHTTRDPARAFVSRIKALENRDGILSISVAQGFATGDVPEMGTKVLVYTDGDATAAQALARTLADELIGMREQLMVPYRSVDDALDEALAFGQGPIVLADRSDNPGSGAAGDSTYILARLRERGIRGAALGPMWDPVAARIAFDAGVGAELDLRIGGKIGPLSGSPVDARCRVVGTHANMMMTGNADTRIALGDCALVDADGILIALVSLRTQAYHTDLFTQLGCDLKAQRLIVVKSAHHFYARYAPLAHAVLYVAAPGSASPDWRSLPYRKIRLPKWPIG